MSESKIIFRSGKLFPFQFQYFAVLLFIFTVLLLFLHPLYSPIPLIPALIVFTGDYGLEINSVKKEYRTFNSILFFKSGSWVSFDAIEKIFVNSSYSSQKVYTRVTEGPVIQQKSYNAYIKFKDGEKVFLTARKAKNSVIKKLSRLSEQLGLEITDHTN